MTTKTTKTTKTSKNVVVKGSKKQNPELPCQPFFAC